LPFKFVKTEIAGLTVIEPHIANDDRGCYKKYYEEEIYAANGITAHFTESSDITSRKGALRGIHFQTESSQAKLLHVIRGTIYDVAVDLRRSSSTFGKWKAFVLEESDPKVIYIPEGFAHGFLALEENTVFSYQSSGRYMPAFCGGIAWNDETLNIPWPIDKTDGLILSEKDRHNLTLCEYRLKYGV
jgi:dTDP-4-dehydrorhamnose 3,5-epimerase